jgi:ketosteroid isomerase-like protein
VSEATRRLIQAYNDAWNRQDLDAVCSFHADGFVFENHTAGERADGPGAREHIAGIFERWPTLRFSTRALYTADDFAVCEWTAHAVRPDDGRRIEWDGVDVFPVGDGKLLRKDVYSSSHAPRVLD